MIFYLYISQNTDYFLCVNISIDYDYSDENLVSIEDEHADDAFTIRCKQCGDSLRFP